MKKNLGIFFFFSSPENCFPLTWNNFRSPELFSTFRVTHGILFVLKNNFHSVREIFPQNIFFRFSCKNIFHKKKMLFSYCFTQKRLVSSWKKKKLRFILFIYLFCTLKRKVTASLMNFLFIRENFSFPCEKIKIRPELSPPSVSRDIYFSFCFTWKHFYFHENFFTLTVTNIKEKFS